MTKHILLIALGVLIVQIASSIFYSWKMFDLNTIYQKNLISRNNLSDQTQEITLKIYNQTSLTDLFTSPLFQKLSPIHPIFLPK